MYKYNPCSRCIRIVLGVYKNYENDWLPMTDPWDWYICLHEWLIFLVFMYRYNTSPMDPSWVIKKPILITGSSFEPTSISCGLSEMPSRPKKTPEQVNKIHNHRDVCDGSIAIICVRHWNMLEIFNDFVGGAKWVPIPVISRGPYLHYIYMGYFTPGKPIYFRPFINSITPCLTGFFTKLLESSPI